MLFIIPSHNLVENTYLNPEFEKKMLHIITLVSDFQLAVIGVFDKKYRVLIKNINKKYVSHIYPF